MTTVFPAAQAVRLRRDYAETLVTNAWRGGGKRICVLACGHFREGNRLIGHDLSNIVAVDQEAFHSTLFAATTAKRSPRSMPMSLAIYAARHRVQKKKFDLVYTLGLTDFLDERAMRFLHKLMTACLAPGGMILLANSYLITSEQDGWTRSWTGS